MFQGKWVNFLKVLLGDSRLIRALHAFRSSAQTKTNRYPPDKSLHPARGVALLTVIHWKAIMYVLEQQRLDI